MKDGIRKFIDSHKTLPKMKKKLKQKNLKYLMSTIHANKVNVIQSSIDIAKPINKTYFLENVDLSCKMTTESITKKVLLAEGKYYESIIGDKSCMFVELEEEILFYV